MGYDGGSRGGGIVAAGVMMDGGGSSSFSPKAVDEDAMWEIKMRAKEVMEAGPYPERPGELDCPYYIRTGLCRFGMTCKFNHPLNRKLAVATARMEGGYPERRGQPECQYYLKTGTCKFGLTCKFHHPKEKAGIVGRAQLNSLGYPIRPSEMECSYYLRTGQCKFGNTCKFHHPQLANAMVSFRGSPIYPSVQSPTISRGSYLPSPRWQGHSSYPQMILPQGLMQVPGWNTYPGQVGSISSSEYQQQTAGNGQLFGNSRQSESTNTSAHGTFSSHLSGSITMGGIHTLQNESVFPERPGEPECVFYMKTGDCKYGAVCKYHHPRERFYHVPDCVLNSSGLPLRPGEPLCIFYSRYGICKFGPNCKFDHPEGNLIDGNSSTDVSIIQLVLDHPTKGTNDVEDLEQESEENSIQVSTKSDHPYDDDNTKPTETLVSISEPISSFP